MNLAPSLGARPQQVKVGIDWEKGKRGRRNPAATPDNCRGGRVMANILKKALKLLALSTITITKVL